MVVVVSVDTLETETINSTEGITNLYTLHHFEVTVTIVSIVRSQYGRIHLRDGVEVLSDVTTEFHAELTELENLAGATVEFPTLVLHVTNVSPFQRSETCR